MNSRHRVSTAALALIVSGLMGCAPPGSGGATRPDGGGSGGGVVVPPTTPPVTPLPPGAPPHAHPGDCGLPNPAFCETFAIPAPGGPAGDIDEKVWSFSRWGHETRQSFVRNPVSSINPQDPGTLFPPSLCGKPFAGVKMPNDVVVCDGVGADGTTSGQLNEVYGDQGDFAINSMRIRQLFDFTDRTGTIVFDVDAKVNPLNLGHGWWVELWVTDDQAPMPYHEAPGVLSYPRNGLGINFQGLNSCPQGRSATQVSRVFVTKNYEILHDYPGWELKFDSDQARCFMAADGKLNRFKVSITRDQVEIWASDAGDAKTLHRIAVASMLDLPFSRGYVHLQHSQYNAHKDGAVTPVQTYRWDNVGFDGPTYAVPRSYSFPDNDQPDIDGAGGRLYGYLMNDQDWITLPVAGVALTGATTAALTFTTQAVLGETILYNFNDGPMHALSVALPKANGRDGLRGFAVDVPVAELKGGDNTITFKVAAPQKYARQGIGNLELTVEATD